MLRTAWILALSAGVAIAAPTGPTRPAYGAFGFDTAGMDRTIRPGDEFDDFASGGWRRDTAIPADLARYDMFFALQQRTLDRSRAILDSAARSPGDKAGDFYASFLDEARIEALGVDPVRPWLAAIAAAPDKRALAVVMAMLQRQGVKALFEAGVKQDDGAPDQYVAAIGQDGLGLPDRDYYLKDDPGLVRSREAYSAYLARLLALAGESDGAARAALIVAFEASLARHHWSRSDSRDATKIYNVWSRADFVARAPGFDWGTYRAALGFGDQTRFIVKQPDAVASEAAAWQAAPLAVLKDFLAAQVLAAFAPYLSTPFAEADFAFHGTMLSGASAPPPRWKRGVLLVSNDMGEAIGPAYVRRYFPPAAKLAVDRLVRNIAAAYRQQLRTVAWMTPKTRALAEAKLAAIHWHIGYPDRWRDYKALAIRRDDLVGNVARAKAFEFQRRLDHLGRPIDRGEWPFPPMTVNASIVDYGLTEIVFPAAILQPPFFDPAADPAINYGGIGAVIAHELSHHFDDQGSKYDRNGKLASWWSPRDAARFAAIAARLARQYDGYEPLPGQHIQGKLTLGENIADLAGMTIAHRAWRLSLGGKPAAVLGGFTGDQRFYLGFAQIWRSKSRDAQLRKELLTNPHSPGKQRTFEVRNDDGWYKAFDVRPGDKLYLPPAERVAIW